MQLPSKLLNVPIVEAVFEVRYKAAVPTSSVLPGLLFTQLSGNKSFQRQPAAELPEAFRNSDPNLQYAPLNGLQWENYLILIGDRSFGVACKLPYPGWSQFRAAIFRIVELVVNANVLLEINRCSLKYLNIIPSKFGRAPDIVEFALQLGTKSVRDSSCQARAEIPEGAFLHIVQVISEATTTMADGTVCSGTVIDVDTIRDLHNMKPRDFSASLSHSLDEHHLATKAVFFSCLKAQALEKLEPRYDYA